MEESKSVWEKPQESNVNVPIEEPKNNNLTYAILGVSVVLVLSTIALGVVVYRGNTAQSTNKVSSSVSSSTQSTIEVSSSLSSSSVSSVASQSSVKVNTSINPYFYKYKSNIGKYISFDYPEGATIKVTSSREDKTFTSKSDIESVTISNDLVEIGVGGVLGFDEAAVYTFDLNNPGELIWTQTGAVEEVIKREVLKLNEKDYVFSNSKYEYVLIDLTRFAGKQFLNSVAIEKDSNGKFRADTNLALNQILPAWKVDLGNGSTFVNYSCKAKTTDDVKKCAEVLDKVISTFKVR
jgi:hypothetical protein